MGGGELRREGETSCREDVAPVQAFEGTSAELLKVGGEDLPLHHSGGARACNPHLGQNLRDTQLLLALCRVLEGLGMVEDRDKMRVGIWGVSGV